MQNENTSIEAFYKNLAVIWFGLFTAQFAFVGIVYFVKPILFKFDFSKPILGEYSIIVLIFAGAAILNLTLSFALKKKFIVQSVNDQNIHFVQTAMIVGCAMCEVVSLLGLMLAFVAEYQYYFLWIAVSTLAMIFHFPLRENLVNASPQK